MGQQFQRQSLDGALFAGAGVQSVRRGDSEKAAGQRASRGAVSRAGPFAAASEREDARLGSPERGGLTGYGNIEEFIAVLVTNIYISDVTNSDKSGLREDWYGHGTLESKLADSYRFFRLGTKAFNLIATFCDDNPGFTKMLAKVRAKFQPDRRLLREPAPGVRERGSR